MHAGFTTGMPEGAPVSAEAFGHPEGGAEIDGQASGPDDHPPVSSHDTLADRGQGVPGALRRQSQIRLPLRRPSAFAVAPCPPPIRRRRSFETKEADMNRYILTVPYEFQRNGKTETRFRRVGAIFENARRETGEVFLSVKLDFPVAVTELVAFPPRPEDDTESDDAKP
jgi:hypothetical protein